MLDRSNSSYCWNVTATQMKFIHAWVHRHPAIPSYNPWNMHEQWLSSVKLPLTISYREKEWPGHVSLLRKTRQYIHDGDNHNAQDDNKWKVIINSQCDWPRILTVMLIGLSNFNLWYLFFFVWMGSAQLAGNWRDRIGWQNKFYILQMKTSSVLLLEMSRPHWLLQSQRFHKLDLHMVVQASLLFIFLLHANLQTILVL